MATIWGVAWGTVMRVCARPVAEERMRVQARRKALSIIVSPWKLSCLKCVGPGWELRSVIGSCRGWLQLCFTVFRQREGLDVREHADGGGEFERLIAGAGEGGLYKERRPTFRGLWNAG